jgi:hypothetical protein
VFFKERLQGRGSSPFWEPGDLITAIQVLDVYRSKGLLVAVKFPLNRQGGSGGGANLLSHAPWLQSSRAIFN